MNSQTSMNDPKFHKQISKLLKKEHPYYAELIQDSLSSLKAYDLPMFSQHQIYEVLYMGPNKPITFTIAHDSNRKRAYVLTANPDQFTAICQAENLQLTDASEALELVQAQLLLPLMAKERLYILESINDIRFRPNLEEEEAAIKQNVVREFEKVIIGPAPEKNDTGFECTLYVIHDRQLEQREVFVSQSGEINQVVKVLASDLPLPYLM